MKLRRPAVAILFLASAMAAAPAVAQSVPGCGDLRDSTGPYDYRKADPSTLALVEKYHFTVRVEQLLAGQSGKIGADLDYTLRAFPNHHRALLAMVKYAHRIKLPHVPGAKFPVECYFMRGLSFTPDDTIVRLLYADLLFKSGRAGDADLQLRVAVEQAGDNGFSHYNIGLVAAENRRYELALRQAKRAAELGFERPQLREMLAAAGHWRDPSPASGASAPRAPEPSAKP